MQPMQIDRKNNGERSAFSTIVSMVDQAQSIKLNFDKTTSMDHLSKKCKLLESGVTVEYMFEIVVY